MNLEMIHDFGQNYPEYLEGTLDYIGVSTICQFNRRGTLLAVGCNDGKVLIWDFLTREVAKCLTCHIWPICCISWSRDSNNVLTACADNTVCIWNVLNGDCLQQYRFMFPLQLVVFAPRCSSKILVVPVKQIPILICRDRNEEVQVLNAKENLQETNVMAGFDHRGQHLFVVLAGGKVFVIDVATAKEKNCINIAGVAASCTAKQIEYARRGSSILISGSDRVIRIVDAADLLNLPTGEANSVIPQQRLQDLVNKTQWRKCCFSGDGEYVCASTTKQHNIYIWEKESGSLVQILSGAKGETIVDIAWHPIHPVITTVANGVVSIWSQDRAENWSGLVPNFRELDENVEYEERESEFDDYDEDKTASAKPSTEDDDISIDVCGVNPIPAFLSSDEEFENPKELVYISTVPEIDDPEDSNDGSVDSLNDSSGEMRHNGQTSLGLARPYKRTANEVAKTAPSQPPAPAISKDVVPVSATVGEDSTSRSSVDLVRGDEEEMAGTRKRAANTSVSRCKTRSTGSISSATSTTTVMTSDGAEYSLSSAEKEKNTSTPRKHRKWP